MEKGMQEYLVAKHGHSDEGLEYWDGYTEALELLAGKIDGDG